MSKESAQRIFLQTLAAIDIGATVEKSLARTGVRICAGEAVIDLSRYREIVGIAFGKASFAMAEALTRVLQFREAGRLTQVKKRTDEFRDWLADAEKKVERELRRA